jgi:prepilin signal peptidase PulO-like enzyme (type II secretory pathway)
MAAALLDASLLALLGSVTVTDLRWRIVPDRALVAALVVAVPLCLLDDPTSLPGRLLAAAGAGSFLLVAALLRPDGMGLGDVKLAAILGFYLGPAVIEAMLVAFLAGSAVGVALVVRHGLQARSRTIPFAPLLALGALAAVAPQP